MTAIDCFVVGSIMIAAYGLVHLFVWAYNRLVEIVVDDDE